MEFPSAYATDATDYLSKGMALRDAMRDENRLSFCLAPHAPYTVSDATFAKVATLVGEIDVPVHVHLHETEDEIRRSLAEHGVRPLERLRRLGLLRLQPAPASPRLCILLREPHAIEEPDLRARRRAPVDRQQPQAVVDRQVERTDERVANPVVPEQLPLGHTAE